MFTAADELRFLTRQLRAATEYRANLEALMSDASQAVSDLTGAIDAAVGRIDADFTELRRQLAESQTLSAQEKATLDATVTGIQEQVARLSSVDPDPSFPAPAPTPQPSPSPAPGV